MPFHDIGDRVLLVGVQLPQARHRDVHEVAIDRGVRCHGGRDRICPGTRWQRQALRSRRSSSVGSCAEGTAPRHDALHLGPLVATGLRRSTRARLFVRRAYDGFAATPPTKSMITYYELGASKQLNEIVVAGSHDAGITSGGTNVKTQALDIGEQAQAGVRVFDLRIAATSVPGQRARFAQAGGAQGVPREPRGHEERNQVAASRRWPTGGPPAHEVQARRRGFWDGAQRRCSGMHNDS